MNGYNQKLHLLVDLYIKSLKSVGNDTTEEQFNVFVQQLYKAYENISLKPKAISKELRIYILEAHREPLYEKNKLLSTIRFEDFQQFCNDYCKEIQIKAIIQGNVMKDQALGVMHNVLNALNCGKIENVSLPRRSFARITSSVQNVLQFCVRMRFCSNFTPICK